MLIGNECKQLDRRITSALCSGALRTREASFLQYISRKIMLYGERAFLRGDQASWLFTILTSFESKERARPKPTRSAARKRDKEACLSPEAIRRMRIEAGVDPDGFDAPKTTPTRSPTLLDAIEAGIDFVSLDPLEDRPAAFDVREAME
jgi:hypothetical protein